MSLAYGDILVVLFRTPGSLENYHWALGFLKESVDNMDMVHAVGSYEDGWIIDKMSSYAATKSGKLLRLVRIGNVPRNQLEVTITTICRSFPAINRTRSFDCKVWVTNVIRWLDTCNPRLVIVRENNYEALMRECQLLADSAANNARMGSLNVRDVRWAQTCRHPPYA